MPGPVVIGAPEKAGTDVVTALLRRFKFSLGADLSPDGVWQPAQLLLNRPSLQRAFVDNGLPDCHREFDLLLRCAGGDPVTQSEQTALLRRAVKDHAGDSERIRWAFQVAGRVLEPTPVPVDEYRGWGFALPSSHLLLPQLADHFPRLRFVYVVRDGLTAARGGDYEQLDAWGGGLNVRRYHDQSRRPHEMLKYWLRTTRQVVDRARRFAPGRVLRLDLEHLARQPYASVTALIDFLGVEAEEPEVETAVRSIERALNPDQGRRQRAGDDFPRRDLRQLARLRSLR